MTTQVSWTPDCTCYYRTTVLHEIIPIILSISGSPQARSYMCSQISPLLPLLSPQLPHQSPQGAKPGERDGSHPSAMQHLLREARKQYYFFFFPGVLNAITLSYFYQHPFISIEPEMNSWDWARKKRYIWVATFRLYPESPLSLTANTWL